jgi:hypothetical protein
MPVRIDLGRRVELVSLDPSFHDVSVGLYRKDTDGGPLGLVHSYSGQPGIEARLDAIRNAMSVLGGLQTDTVGDDRGVRLPCGGWHDGAMKRLFLDCFRVDLFGELEPKPLAAPDTRSDQYITVVPLGSGVYRVDAEGGSGEEPSRAPAIARALVRLVELDEVDDTTVAFRCGHDHHELMGLMLVRAQNLRAALREEELTSSRGVLAAPGAQE